MNTGQIRGNASVQTRSRSVLLSLNSLDLKADARHSLAGGTDARVRLWLAVLASSRGKCERLLLCVPCAGYCGRDRGRKPVLLMDLNLAYHVLLCWSTLEKPAAANLTYVLEAGATSRDLFPYFFKESGSWANMEDLVMFSILLSSLESLDYLVFSLERRRSQLCYHL